MALGKSPGEGLKIIDKKKQLEKGQRIALVSALLLLALALLKAVVGYGLGFPPFNCRSMV